MRLSAILLCLPAALVACGAPQEPNNISEADIVNASRTDTIVIPEDADSRTPAAANADDGINAADQANDMTHTAPRSWLGRWTGPEGLFLEVREGSSAGRYTLTLKDNLDSQADYEATGDAQSIRFTRNGKQEVIRAGSGAETGFKYLDDKKNCLIIVPDKEGYCRD